MKKHLPILGLLLFLFSSCSHKLYVNEAYLKRHNLEGKTLAILPAQVQFTGNLPKGVTELERKRQEEREALNLQAQLYNEILYRSSKNSSKKGEVKLMDISTVNQKLKSNGIGIQEASILDVHELAKLLGADLVIRVQVQKNRFMSDMASLGISTAVDIAGVLMKDRAPVLTPKLNKTYDVNYRLTVYDAAQSTNFTTYTRSVEADWNDTPEAIFAQNAKYFAKRAPIKSE